MSTTTTLNGYNPEKLIEFLDKTIYPETIAKYIRRMHYVLALSVIREDENKNPLNKDWLDDSFFWLNELAEILDPYLETE